MDKRKSAKIVVSKNGPYLVSGCLPLQEEIVACNSKGIPLKWKKGKKFKKQGCFALCRCGNSKNKPFCDETHAKTGFNGSETFSGKKFVDIAKIVSGPGLLLADAEELCSGTSFCHRAGGTWELTRRSDDPESKKIAIQESWDCPSGRLVAMEKNGEPVEAKFRPSIGVIQEPERKVSGPLWIKGNVPIESCNGKLYEIRNRITLCRCGKSGNKPFCDGTHYSAQFSDRKNKN
ncbi:MAG: CDGSH iron-sulfur domain-containing protein [Candidatus ainarchaeum sp.]|nr:CDGSH iron-sulfur domain-containing protein [Candidatus ainarchaeum sp.]